MSNPNWNNGLQFLQFCYSVCVMLKMSFRKLPLQTHHCEELYINTYVINHIWVTLPFKLCCSVTELCPILCEPMDCSTPGPSVPHYLIKFAQVHIHCIGGAIQTSHPLMPSSPSDLNLSQHRGLFQESAVHSRWANYWGFSLSISPSNEYSELISLKIDWFNLLAVQGTLRSLLQHYSLKA